MKNLEEYKDLNTAARAFARSQGRGTVTQIIVSEDQETPFKIHSYHRYGYYKNTTGEGPMPNKYLSNFGWKNTHYEHAKTTVSINRDTAKRFGLTI